MKNPTPKHHRKSIRLQNYDYSQNGAYFITICVDKFRCLFGRIIDGEMVLNKCGKIAQDEWQKTATLRKNIRVDEFIIMPNHIHGIIIIENEPVGAYCDTPLREISTRAYRNTPLRSPSNNLGAIIRGYKSAVTTRINQLRNTPSQKLWQRNYHEHVISDTPDLNKIREYIINNPLNWQNDKLFAN